MSVRVAIPTRDRPGNLALCLSSVATHLGPNDDLFLYDDGDRPAVSDYGTRFALDIATQRGASVVIKRGLPHGIALARARILKDALSDGVTRLRMIDDDCVVPETAWWHIWNKLEDIKDAQFAVPTIALANNEAGIEKFGAIKEASSVHDQQFVMGKTGWSKLLGGSWTNDIAFALDRFSVVEAIQRLEQGPPVVEDYVLTAPLSGIICYDARIWHCMSPDQGERAWNSAALAYLRKQLSIGKAIDEK